MKTIRAIFKGRNGSFGFQSGKEYTLEISEYRFDRGIMIKDINRKDGDCEYSGIIAFLKNWDNIKVL